MRYSPIERSTTPQSPERVRTSATLRRVTRDGAGGGPPQPERDLVSRASEERASDGRQRGKCGCRSSRQTRARWVRHEDEVQERPTWAARVGGVQLDPVEVLGADVSVLVRTDEAGRGAVISAELAAVQAIREEHGLAHRVVDREHRSPPLSNPRKTRCVTTVPGASLGAMLSRYTVWNGTPSHRSCVADHPATQWKSLTTSRLLERRRSVDRHTERFDPDSTDLDERVLRHRRPAGGVMDLPNRGNPSIHFWPGGSPITSTRCGRASVE